MATSFLSIFSGSQAASFYGFLLPWLFTFAIVFGLLSKADLFGKTSKQVNVALAFVIAFFVTGLGGPQLASFFVNFFGGSAIFLAGILVFLLFWTLLGQGDDGKVKKYHTGAIGLIFIVIVAAVLWLTSTGTLSGRVFIDSETASLVFWLIIILVAGYLITKGGSDEAAAKPK
jgi:hypothetical protein